MPSRQMPPQPWRTRILQLFSSYSAVLSFYLRHHCRRRWTLNHFSPQPLSSHGKTFVKKLQSQSHQTSCEYFTIFHKRKNPQPQFGTGIRTLQSFDKSGLSSTVDCAPRCNGGEWVFRPVVLRIATAHVLADELVPFSPESRKVFRYLDWPLCRRKKRHNDRNFPARDLRRLH